MWLFEDKILEYVEQTQLKLSVFAAKYALVKGNHTIIEQIVGVWVRPRPAPPTAAALELDAGCSAVADVESLGARTGAGSGTDSSGGAEEPEAGALEGEHKSLEYLLHLVDFSALFALNDTFRMRDLSEKLRCARLSDIITNFEHIVDWTEHFVDCLNRSWILLCGAVCRCISNQYEEKVSVSSRKIHELIQKSFEVRALCSWLFSTVL